MIPSVRLGLVLHDAVPIGEPQAAFVAAHRDRVAPLLGLLESFQNFAISLHLGGSLLTWLHQHHPESIAKLRQLVGAGRVEILGGPFYEPILPMVNRRDRIGQIEAFSHWLATHLDAAVHGMWLPRAIWETAIIPDIVEAGIEYTLIESARILPAEPPTTDPLVGEPVGHYLTESGGRVLRIVATSDELAHAATRKSPRPFIDHCWRVAQARPGQTLAFATDLQSLFLHDNASSKHSDRQPLWPESLCAALAENAAWLKLVPLAKAIRQSDCGGRVTVAPQHPTTQHDWRSDRIRHPAVIDLYGQMSFVSRQLEFAQEAKADRTQIASARDHLYRAQSHAAFLGDTHDNAHPHPAPPPKRLQTAEHHLILADTTLDRALAALGEAEDSASRFVDATVEDFDFDHTQEVRLANDRSAVWVAPARGGMIYQWDHRPSGHNLLTTLHPRHCPPRKSLIDRFFDDDVTPEEVIAGTAYERGDFFAAPFDARLRRANDRVQLRMSRLGAAWGLPVALSKAITISAESNAIELTYLLENLPPNRSFHFGVEFHFTALIELGRNGTFRDARRNPIAKLDRPIDLDRVDGIALDDTDAGLQIDLTIDRPSSLWGFPITPAADHTDHVPAPQAVCLIPHWQVRGDDAGRWAVKMTCRVAIDDRRASELRMTGLAPAPAPFAAAVG